MALSEDQRALLRLLLSGDTYEQVADVLGIQAAEVRTRAHEAANELREAPDREFPPGSVSARLEALEGASGAIEQPSSAPPAQSAARRPWLLWLALGAAAVVAVVALVVALGGGGGDGDTTTSVRSDREDVVPIRLAPVGGAKARGMISVKPLGQ